MQAKKVLVVADGSEHAAEGALRDKARSRTRLEPTKIQEREPKPSSGETNGSCQCISATVLGNIGW
jgi:hypothetical protein